MASQEELSLILKMVADLGDAQKVITFLNQLQATEKQTQQTTDQLAQSVGKVTDREAAAISNANAMLQQGMKSLEPTLQNFQKTVAGLNEIGVRPTLGPEAFGIQGLQAEGGGPEKLGAPVTRAFATLTAAEQRQLAGGVNPEQARLDAARRQQVEQYAKLNAQAEREANAEQKAADAAEANAARIEAGFRRRQAAQGETQQVPTAEDPSAQARLYQARAAQQRQFDALVRERARAAGRGEELPTEGASQGAITALERATQAQVKLGDSANISYANLIRLGAAFTGFGIGLSLWTAAGRLANAAIVDLADQFLTLDQSVRANNVTLGTSAAAYQGWARVVSEQAGVTQRSLLDVGTAAAQFGRNIGLGPQQIEGLSSLAVLLARIRGQNPTEVMVQLSSALQGNAQAADALNLQLDAGYLAFTQLGGATQEVFDTLDPSTQAWLRYSAAFGQVANQVQSSVPELDALRKAQGDLNVEWEKFADALGPGVLSALAKILASTKDLAQFVQEHPDLVKKLLGDLTGLPITEAQQGIDTVRNAYNAVGDLFANNERALHDRQAGLARDVFSGEYIDVQTGATVELAEAETRLAEADQRLAQSHALVADQSDRATASAQAQAQHNQQMAEFLDQLGQKQGVLNAARANEIEANRLLVDSKLAQVQLAGQEAEIRLQMLPSQERMLELQNATTQAQIRAQQAALPSSRGLQDLQNQIRLQTLIAQSPDRSMEERLAALARATALTRRTPEAEIGALQGQLGALPAERAAQDVQMAAQLQSLQQQQALFSPEYQRQQLSLLSQIADSAKQTATREIRDIQTSIKVDIHGAGELSETDKKRIADIIGGAAADSIWAQLHAGVQTVSNRGAPPQLMAATGPS